MIRTQIELERRVLNPLVKELILDKGERGRWETMGVDYRTWPECQAKQAMKEFEIQSKIKSLEFARFMCWDMLEKLQCEELPEDEDMILVMYQEGLRTVRALNLAQALMANPDRAKEHIENFNKFTGYGVEMKSLSEALWPCYEKQVALAKEDRSLVKIKNFENLSEAIGGFNPGRLTLITAQSGVGKTTLARNLVLGAADSSFSKVLFFNMEMTEQDFVQGFVQSEGDLTFSDWTKNPEAQSVKVQNALSEVNKKAPIYFTEGKSLSLEQIVSSCYREREDMMLVVIDYDQKIATDSNEEEWRYLVRSMERIEELAKSIECHCIVLAQGDESGDVKASKRSKQPASCVLQIAEDDDLGYVITAIKNRFGKHKAKVPVLFIPEKGIMRETAVRLVRRKSEIEKKYKKPYSEE